MEAGREMVGGVLALDGLDDVGDDSELREARPDLCGVPASGLVLVGDDHDRLSAPELLGELHVPLAGAHRVTGRDTPGGLDRQHVLLALDDVDRLAAACVEVRGDLRQPEQHAAGPVEVPDVAAVAVRATLHERLVGPADDLEQELSVDVEVGVDDLAHAASPPRPPARTTS